MGVKLLASKRPKDIKLQTQAKDEFQEIDYSAVHFDLHLVIQLVKQTIAKVSDFYSFILLEGLCNSQKLIFDDDRLELRFMDEFFMIEKNIGEVQAVMGLQFNYEKEYMEESEVEYEQFPEPPPVEVKRKGENEDEEEQEQPPADEEEKQAPKFRVEDYRWTVTDRRPKNLPQLYYQCKGVNTQNDVKTAEQYSSSQYEAISKCLDDFCQKLNDLSSNGKYLYQQVIFNE